MFPFISHSDGLDEKPSFWIAVERINFLGGNEAAPITELLGTLMIITSLSICWSEYNDWLGNSSSSSSSSLLPQVLSTSLVLPSFSFIRAWAKEFKHSYLCAWSASQSAWHFLASAAAFLDLDIKKSMLRSNMLMVMRRWAAAQGDLPERALRDPDFLPSSRCLELWLWLRKLSKLR